MPTKIGATPAADAFFVAFRVPSLLRELFAEGSMSSAFIPVFTEYRTTRGKQEVWELASAVFTTLLTVVTLVTILGILVAPWLVQLLAPGFEEHPGKLALTTLLARIMFPYLLFISLAALAMGILNSVRAFAAPAQAPAGLPATPAPGPDAGSGVVQDAAVRFSSPAYASIYLLLGASRRLWGRSGSAMRYQRVSSLRTHRAIHHQRRRDRDGRRNGFDVDALCLGADLVRVQL